MKKRQELQQHKQNLSKLFILGFQFDKQTIITIWKFY